MVSGEVNVTILARGAWFWAPQKHPRSLSQLFDIYFTSVGRNANLILNLSPDRRGLIPDDQLEALRRLSLLVNDTFATNLAAGGTLVADSSNPNHNPSLALDGDLDTWWEAAAGRTNDTLTLTLPAPVTFDVVSLQEAVDHRGQRIESFAIDVWNVSGWVPAECVPSDRLTTVGHRRLIRLMPPVTASRMQIRITGSRLEPTLAEIGLFKKPVSPFPPTISDRDADGLVTISNVGGYRMVYTVDGAAPMARSPAYNLPFTPPPGSTVQAACLMPNGQLGIVVSKTFAGLPSTGWKVVAVDSQKTNQADNAAAKAIDGDSSTFWHSRWNEDLTLPHFITVDMGKPHRVAGSLICRDRTEIPMASSKITALKRARTESTGRPMSFPAHLPTFATIRRFRKSRLRRSSRVSSASPPCRKSTRTAGRAPPKSLSCLPEEALVEGAIWIHSFQRPAS